MSGWVEWMAAAFVFYEAVFLNVYKRLQALGAQGLVWVILGSKVLKLLLSLVSLLLVKQFSTLPLRTYALTLVGFYGLSLVVESIILLKKKHSDEKQS